MQTPPLGLLLLPLVLLFACEEDRATARLPGERGETAPDRAPESVEEQLLREFRGTYAERAPEPSATREFSFAAAPTELDVAGGRLRVWAYDGQVPGPTLRVRLGEALRVRFDNRLPQPTTIHWHGVRVPNAMDGVPGVTQAPILPGEDFVYEFAPKDAGTFWFHPHVRGSEQVERGLFGVLIVDDPEPLPYSRDVVWVLDDWRLRDGQIDPRFNTRHDLAHDGRWGNVITVNGQTDEVLSVHVGERVRLRLVNTSNARVYTPDFSPLAPRAIAVDGMYASRPFDPSGFDLAPGNRLDLDFTVPRELAGETVEIVDRFYARRPNVLARIAVSTRTVETPGFASPARARMPEWSAGRQVAPFHTFALDSRRGGPHGIQWLINDRAYGEHEPTALPRGRWLKLRFENRSARLHPMHMHGQFFRVLSRNGQPVDEPHWRDTVLLRRRETVDIGIVPLDEGDWMMHCHILEHAEAGMMTVVRVRRADVPEGGDPGG